MPELFTGAVSRYQEADETPEETEARLDHSLQMRYRAVQVYFGDEDIVVSGTTKITRNIFAGTQDRTENAMLFLENMSKVKSNQSTTLSGSKAHLLRKGKDGDGLMSQASYATASDGDRASMVSERRRMQAAYNSDSGFESLEAVHEDEHSADDDEVLLNISPHKYE